MSGTAIAAVWPLAPRIVGQVLGLPFTLYRPRTSGTIVSGQNWLGDIRAWITADANLMAAKPFAYGKPVGYAAVDPAVVLVGDYLIGSLTLLGDPVTFFVASMDIPSPIQVVLCNQILTITRPIDEAPGPNAYGGAKRTSGAPIITSWPASVLQGKTPRGGDLKDPGDGNLARMEVLLPLGAPELRMGDVIRDAQTEPNIYTVESTELTPLGWRCEVWAASA